MFKKFNWGHKIALLYISFVIFILSFSFAAFRQKVELVDKNYYDKELKFEDKINSIKSYNQLKEEIFVKVNNHNSIEIKFPEEISKTALKGTIRLYCSYDETLDENYKIKVDGNGIQNLKTKLKNGTYTVLIDFNDKTKDYYFEKQIHII